MEEEFIKLEQALELKKLNFNEKCIGIYMQNYDSSKYVIELSYNDGIVNDLVGIKDKTYTLAPLYQQVFSWFRDKKYLHSYVYEDGRFYYFKIQDLTDKMRDCESGLYYSYEEARYNLLKKLIEKCK